MTLTQQDENIRWLFCQKYDELNELVLKRDSYDLTKASAILRQLLVDGTPLMHQANRLHRLKITFPITQFTAPNPNGIIMWFKQHSLFPPEKPDDSLDYLPLKKFLSKKVMIVYGKLFSILDMILFEANFKGGVHTGTKYSNEREPVLDYLGKIANIMNDRPTRQIISSIGLSVVEGLQELRQLCS